MTSSIASGPPNETTSNASKESLISLSLAELVYRFDELYHMVNRRFWQNSVTQIKDMAGSVCCPVENITRPFADMFDRSKQFNRVKVPHDRDIIADQLPPVIQIDTPVKSDHIAASLFHQLQQRSRTCAEMKHRRP